MFRYATVTRADPNGYYVTFFGEDIESSFRYNKLATYSPVLGDRVAILIDGKKYLCLGKIN